MPSVSFPAQKGKTGNFSTGADVLEDLQFTLGQNCPKVVLYVKEYRSLTKLLAFLAGGDEDTKKPTKEPLKPLLNKQQLTFPAACCGHNGRTILQVCAQFRQTESKNARLSTEAPNLQV